MAFPAVALLTLAWLEQMVDATEYLSCQALRDTTLSPGFWRPAVIMDSLDLSLENLRTAPVDEQVQLHGLCQVGTQLQSDAFVWQKPGNEGGEWLATTSTTDILLQTGMPTPCRLTGIALGSTAPTLRLQFEECDGKAAVVVMLRPQKGGMKLVQWICAVSAGTDLCQKAQAAARNNTVPTNVVSQTLDLTGLSTSLSQGILHTNARSACFENLQWFTAQGGLGIDEKEWPLLMEIRKLMAPKQVPKMPVEVEVQVSELCFPSCKDEWNVAVCGVKPALKDVTPVPTPPPVEVPGSALLSRQRLEKFTQALGDTETAPWVWLVLVFGLMLGAFFAMLLFPLFRHKETGRKGPMRYKQVEFIDGTGTSVPIRMTR